MKRFDPDFGEELLERKQPRVESEPPPALCALCGEPIVGRRANARLCRRCAAGKRVRLCQRCGKEFRGVRARYCPECRSEMAREAQKQLRASQGEAAQVLDSPVDPIEPLLSNELCPFPSSPSPEGILALRRRLSMSQAELGKALGVGRNWPYSAAYISKLEKGKLPITDEIRQAVGRLHGGTQHLRILPRSVYATTDLPAGTVILGQPVIDPVCGGVFIMPYANQRYCSPECRKEARRRRRLARAKADKT